MKMTQKRLMAINDISCLGKCSLTVALPVISACSIEVCPVPTAILSTHTGGFTGYSFKDLSDDPEVLVPCGNQDDLGAKMKPSHPAQYADTIYTVSIISFPFNCWCPCHLSRFHREPSLVLCDDLNVWSFVMFVFPFAG